MLFATILYYLEKIGGGKLTVFFFVISISALLFSKQFVLLQDELRVIYSGLSLLNRYKVKNIDKVYFGSNNAVADPCVIKIYCDGKCKKYYFFAHKELQELIDKLRELGVDVDVKSHIWT